jgi:hypothetical protein
LLLPISVEWLDPSNNAFLAVSADRVGARG